MALVLILTPSETYRWELVNEDDPVIGNEMAARYGSGKQQTSTKA